MRKYTVLFSSLMFLSFAGILLADSRNVELVSQLGGGGVNCLCISGNYAYINEGDYLRVVNISSPTNLVALGRVRAEAAGARDMCVSGNYVYIAAWGAGLRIIDVSNPNAPQEVGSLRNPPSSAYAVTAQGDYVWVADFSTGIRCINVADPTAPYEVSNNRGVPPAEEGWHPYPGARGVEVQGDYLYVIENWLSEEDYPPWTQWTGYYGLWNIYNVSDPSLFTLVNWAIVSGMGYPSPKRLVIQGNYAFIAAAGGVYVYEIPAVGNPNWYFDMLSDPLWEGPSELLSIFVSGNYVYAGDSSGTGRVTVLNWTNPSDPEVGSFNTPGVPSDIWVSGSYVYVATGTSGLRVYEVKFTPSFSAVEKDNYTPSCMGVLGVDVSGDYAYLAGGEFSVVNVSDPIYPTLVGDCALPDEGHMVRISGNYAFVAADTAGLRVINISDPTDPYEVDSCDTPGEARDVFLLGDYAYVADGTAGLRIIDISTPSSPSEVGFFDTSGADFENTGDIHGVFVRGDYAYVASPDYQPPTHSTLRVIDVSDPTAPVQVAKLYTGGEPRRVFVSGDLAYLTSGYTFFVIDISDPTAPQVIGSCTELRNDAQVIVSGNFAYLAGYDFTVLDISNKYRPTPCAVYWHLGAPGLFVSDDLVYMAGAEKGFHILRCTPDPIVVEEYPNEVAPGGNCYRFRKYEFTLDVNCDIYIKLVGAAQNGAQNGTGDDDDLSIELDGTFYGWNNDDSLDGNAQNGALRALKIKVEDLPHGPHDLILWADETPTLYSFNIAKGDYPEIVKIYPEKQAPGGNCYLFDTIHFTVPQSSPNYYIQLTGLAKNGSQSGTGDDHDLAIQLDDTFYGWNNENSLDGNAQNGSVRTVKIRRGFSYGQQHTLRLWADETPVLNSIILSFGDIPEVAEVHPTETAPGGNCYLWRKYDFTLDAASDLYIQLIGAANSTTQNPSGDDDDLGIQLDTTFYGWNNADSLDGISQQGSTRPIDIKAEDVSAGLHTLILWADETPVLSSLKISKMDIPETVEIYPKETAPEGNCYLFKAYEFTLENESDVHIQLTGLAHNGTQNGTGDDDDLAIQLDSTFFGWNNEDSLDGNPQDAYVRTVNIHVSDVSAGSHTLILWADETPVVHSISVIAK